MGTRIVVPELIPAVDALPPSGYPSGLFSPDASEQIPRPPVGSKMVLFLKKSPSEPENAEWEPANWMDSMKASVVWIEGDQLYCFMQVVNPGPSVLQPMSTQEELNSVLTAPDTAQRAHLLKPFVHSDSWDARKLALEELGKSGPAAVPVIQEMLDDSAYAEQAPELIQVMVKAGGAAIGLELARRFLHEVAFWESTGPSLTMGWWNRDAAPDAPLRLQYMQTFELIIGLQQTLDKDALAPAERLRDLWVAHPALDDPSGLNQMSQECEKLIALLESNQTR